eukprot:TRINITY_DN3969_c0_g1_i2.p2 TRINITY_DN3969_c0_g1~~TRINITY_DN3969_c0_g1_i2.p2  ORF type:complete len:221 (+),score=77.89 TRINITY_DN3969_c0_g1_i2:46-663(+)
MSEQKKKQNTINKICVYLGSSEPEDSVYGDKTEELGKTMAERGIGLVYGGGGIGLMGKLSRAVAENGGDVLGVIPKAMVEDWVMKDRVGEEIIVNTMHERKTIMCQKADAFIAVPGGFGTMEELLESITWAQLGIHSCPIGLYNIEGYWDGLIAMIKHSVDVGFIKKEHGDLFVVSDDADELINKLIALEVKEGVFKWDDDEGAI